MLTITMKLLLAFLLPLTAALKFDMQAHPGAESAAKERCIRNFVAKDQLVVVTATVSGNRGDGQTLNMHVCFTSIPPPLRGGVVARDHPSQDEDEPSDSILTRFACRSKTP